MTHPTPSEMVELCKNFIEDELHRQGGNALSGWMMRRVDITGLARAAIRALIPHICEKCREELEAKIG